MSKKIILSFFFSFFIVLGIPLISSAQDGDVTCDIPYSDLTLDTDIEGEYTCQFIGYSDSCTDTINKDQVFYISASSDNEIVVYLHSDKRYNHYDCFGYMTLSNDNVVYSFKNTYWYDNLDSYYTSYISQSNHKVVKNSDYISEYISIKGVRNIVNNNTDSDNRKNIVLQTNVKVFDTYENALQYLIDGNTNGMLDDGKPYDIDDISFSSFKVIPHKSASFDNFYFEVRYDLSPYVQNNIDNATITVTQKYEGSLLVEKSQDNMDVPLHSSGSFSSYAYGPYSTSVTIPLKYARAGFTPYLKDMNVFKEYFNDSFPASYLCFDTKKKMQLLGYKNWQTWDFTIADKIKTFKPESSRLYLIGNITVNGESGKPFTFCYDFLEGQGETEYIPWEEDEPNPEPIVDTVVPDDEPIVDTSTDGNGVNINIDIDNNNVGGSGEYVDVNPDDYRSFIGMYKDTMGEFKTEGNTFEFLKGAMSCLPADIWALIAGGLGACIVISLIVIFRGR